MNKYLGLDLGSKTIGVSISESGIIASNLETIRFTDNNYEEALILLIKTIEDRQITHVVLGVPRHMNNDLGIRGQISVDFGKKIEEKTTVKVILWDERLTTKQALDTLIEGQVRRDKQKRLKDELAATIILQNYLNSISN